MPLMVYNMAKFEDYAHLQEQGDDLEQEIGQAKEQSTERKKQNEVDWEKRYSDLERLNSQQSNELGELRRQAQAQAQAMEQLMSRVQEPPQDKVEDIDPITLDDIYDDPMAAIEKVAERKNREIIDKLERLEHELTASRTNDEFEKFKKDYPDYQERASSDDMRAWIQERDYRVNLARRADEGDLSAARELFDMYADLQGISQEKTELQRERDLDAASLESGSSGLPSSVDTYSRAELEVMRIKARRGDLDAQAYLKKNNKAILDAYAEERIVD